LPINAPVRAGEPGCGFPWQWTIVPWFDGAAWADAGVRDQFEAATILGMFLAALGKDAPADAPTNPYRGGPLTDRDAPLRARVDQLGDTIDRGAVLALWDDALAAPPATTRRWVHGDLHPANIVVRDGVLVAVIDWVDLCAGDTAYDLAAGWFCFEDPAARAVFQSSTGIDDDATWVRARACALSHAIAVLANSADNPRMHTVGERTLRAVLAP
jgi:aminoglycoside phosphotransferase (APT) family kinase protein